MSSLGERRGRKRRQRMAAMKPERQKPGLGAKAKNAAQSAGQGVLGALQRVDDSTQAFARNQLLQLPTDGTRLGPDATLGGVRNALGEMIFAARPNYAADKTAYRGDGTMGDTIGLGLTRALQGGAITAAGAGLAALTTQFGSAADYQEPNQLSL